MKHKYELGFHHVKMISPKHSKDGGICCMTSMRDRNQNSIKGDAMHQNSSLLNQSVLNEQSSVMAVTALLLLIVCTLSPSGAAQTVQVDATPSDVVNTFSPLYINDRLVGSTDPRTMAQKARPQVEELSARWDLFMSGDAAERVKNVLPCGPRELERRYRAELWRYDYRKHYSSLSFSSLNFFRRSSGRWFNKCEAGNIGQTVPYVDDVRKWDPAVDSRYVVIDASRILFELREISQFVNSENIPGLFREGYGTLNMFHGSVRIFRSQS